jgi:hypothetical protein
MAIIVDDRTPETSYTVGGSPQTEFVFNRAFFEDGDLEVYVGTVKNTLNADYTLTGEGTQDDGKVIFNTALTNTTVFIRRRVPIKRTANFPESGSIARLGAALPRRACRGPQHVQPPAPPHLSPHPAPLQDRSSQSVAECDRRCLSKISPRSHCGVARVPVTMPAPRVRRATRLRQVHHDANVGMRPSLYDAQLSGRA